jgi:hypothetical protein
MAPERPLRVIGFVVWIAEPAGAVHHQGDPMVAPGDVLRVADLPQEHDLLAVGADCTRGFVDHLNIGSPQIAAEEAMKRSVGTVFAEILDDGLQRRSHGPAYVYHETIEVVVA